MSETNVRIPGLGPWRQDDPPAGFVAFPDEAVLGSIGERFLAVAEQRSEHQALSSPAGTWTYEAFTRDALRVARAVVDHAGSDEPRPIAIAATHDGPLVIAILGVILAGHVVVVLDPMAPADQLSGILAAAKPAAILHDAAQAELVAGLGAGAPLVSLDDLGPEALPGLAVSRTPDDPVMLAFTSGTSGEPKGAIITHGVLMNLVRGATNALGITRDDRMPMLFPTSLAVAAYPMFLPLLNGGTLATLDVRSVGLNPIADFLADERITLAYMAPTVVRFLVDALAGRTFPDLRMIALGGELVDAEVVALTAELLGPRHVGVGFGTTETGVISLYVVDADAELEGTVPTGYAVPDVELLVIDGEGNEAPVGESGEVAVATPYLFTGYWGHPELSAQVLSEDPRGRHGWRLYRTGDLGRLDEHGALTVVGRLDNKVKVRGKFVVVGDVEAALHEIDAVGDAVVAPVSVDNVTELAAMVAPADVDVTAVRAEMLKTQESFRVPSRWLVVDAIPQLPNGKLDRKAITAALQAAEAERAGDRSGTRGAAETAEGAEAPVAFAGVGAATLRSVRAIWERLLPVETVQPEDDFAHLGGDSLRAAQMVIMIEDELGVTVPMSRLLEARTLRQVSEVVDELRTAARDTTVARVQAGDPAQRPRLWFFPDLPGSAYRVRHLAAALGVDQPVWSIESPFLSGEPNPYTSLDAFVKRLVNDIVAEQPEGPYWLAGYSFGGICAYEAANQLRERGAEVAFIGVIDVGPGYRGPDWTNAHSPAWPYFGVPRPPAEGASLAEVVAHYRQMVSTSPLGALRHLTLRTGLARHLDKYRFRADIAKVGRVRPEWRLWYAWEEHWRLAVRAWDRTKRFDGTVHLLWADETASADSTMGWGPLVADLRIERFDGNHHALLEEHGVAPLAATLRSVLDAAIAERA